jgi:hypothetical protein
MANTYALIKKVTVESASVANVEFTSVPNTYTDLLVKISVRTNVNSLFWGWRMTFNSSASSYSGKTLSGNGSSVSSSNQTSPWAGSINANNSTSSTFSNIEVYIPNYTSSNYKIYSIDGVTENNATTAELHLDAGLWSDTSAITTIKFDATGATPSDLVQLTNIYLYGIKNS